MKKLIIFEMRKFGRMLTDRIDGKKAYNEISMVSELPNVLDFSNVVSLGSSFGDEVLPKLAEKNNNEIGVKNANQAIVSCIKKIVEDSGIKVEYLK